MNCCEARLNAGVYNPRHDGAHAVLTKAITAENIPNFVKSRSNVTPEPGTSSSTLRPDETVFVKVGSKVLVTVNDVKCYWPSANATVDVDRRNVAKYQSIADGYTRKYHKASKVLTIMLPTAGPVPKATFDALAGMGFKRGKIAPLIRDMMVKVIKGNCAIAKNSRATPAVDPVEAVPDSPMADVLDSPMEPAPVDLEVAPVDLEVAPVELEVAPDSPMEEVLDLSMEDLPASPFNYVPDSPLEEVGWPDSAEGILSELGF